MHLIKTGHSDIGIKNQRVIAVEIFSTRSVFNWEMEIPDARECKIQVTRGGRRHTGSFPVAVKQPGLDRDDHLETGERQIRVTQTPWIRLTTTSPRRIVMAVQILHPSFSFYVKTA